MSYVSRVLQPGETLEHIARLHWVMYAPCFIVLFLSAVFAALGLSRETPEPAVMLLLVAVAFALLAVAGGFRIWFDRWTTEIAVTNRRIIYKTGFIRRLTKEMNIARVETVIVEQGILGRMLNYGTLHIRGTGAGIENVSRIADPFGVRAAVTAPNL